MEFCNYEIVLLVVISNPFEKTLDGSHLFRLFLSRTNDLNETEFYE